MTRRTTVGNLTAQSLPIALVGHTHRNTRPAGRRLLTGIDHQRVSTIQATPTHKPASHQRSTQVRLTGPRLAHIHNNRRSMTDQDLRQLSNMFQSARMRHTRHTTTRKRRATIRPQ